MPSVASESVDGRCRLFTQVPYRYLTVGRYLLVYRVQNDKALVVRVLHELQDSLSIILREVK